MRALKLLINLLVSIINLCRFCKIAVLLRSIRCISNEIPASVAMELRRCFATIAIWQEVTHGIPLHRFEDDKIPMDSRTTIIRTKLFTSTAKEYHAMSQTTLMCYAGVDIAYLLIGLMFGEMWANQAIARGCQNTVKLHLISIAVIFFWPIICITKVFKTFRSCLIYGTCLRA